MTATRQGAVVWIQSANPISIEATDARSNTDITAILDRVQVFTELPTIAPEGYQVEIEGDPGNNFDNYYVAFEPRGGTFNEGSWLETVRLGWSMRSTRHHAPDPGQKARWWFLVWPCRWSSAERQHAPHGLWIFRAGVTRIW